MSFTDKPAIENYPASPGNQDLAYSNWFALGSSPAWVSEKMHITDGSHRLKKQFLLLNTVRTGSARSTVLALATCF